MASKVAKKRKLAIICVVAVIGVAAVTWGGLWAVSHFTAVAKEEREAEIAREGAGYRESVVEDCSGFVGALNELATGVYWDGAEVVAADGEKIESYITKLAAIEVPDEAFLGAVEGYRAAWEKLRGHFVAEEYDETMAAVEAVRAMAEATSKEINEGMDRVITEKVANYERELRAAE